MQPDRNKHVERCIEAARRGSMVVMVDDEDRENEGDLVIPAEHCTAEVVNFMCREGRGLICLALMPDRVEALGLPMMVPTHPGSMGTAFTVSVEAKDGVTTGISAADRARTIQVASDPRFGAGDLVSPGHVFPLRAKAGGVLVRAGHTEGSVDLARLAGCRPAGVICEIMRDDGEMARMDDLRAFAKRHDLPILAIADLIEYRLRTESLVEEIDGGDFVSSRMNIGAGWTLRVFRSGVEPRTTFLAFTHGAVDRGEPVLLRAQRASLLTDVFGSNQDDSGRRLAAAFERISKSGPGVVLYVIGEESVGDGILSGLRADAEGDRGPAIAEDRALRDFGLGAQVLAALGVSRLTVMTNNPRKIVGLEGFGLEVAGSVPLFPPTSTPGAR